MPIPSEIEVKLVALPDVLDVLRRHPLLAGEDHVSTLITTYYDTIGGKLRRGGATLRIRDDGQAREQTLKLASTGKASVRRSEWTCQPSGEQPDKSAMPPAAQKVLLRLLDNSVLEPLGVTRIERTTRRIRYGNSTIEVAFDLGTIVAGQREVPACELELELIEGELADLLRLAGQLPLGPGLHWSVRNKGERCQDLAFDLAPSATRAKSLRLAPGTVVAAGFQTIAWSCLSQLLANFPLVIDTGDPEAVHQSRVAIRRLRAAFSLFRDVIEDSKLPVLRAELKAVANALGSARDLHVLVRQVGDNGELRRHLEALLADATRSVQAMLSTGAFQHLLFDISLWIESGDWLTAASDKDTDLREFAASELARRRRKLSAASGKLLDMPDTARHRLRINAKKLRYGCEFFASLFRDKVANKQRGAFAKALSRLQDSLGELNDMAVATARQESWFTGLEPITAAKLAAELGELLNERHKSRRKLVKSAEASLEAVRESPAWWKTG